MSGRGIRKLFRGAVVGSVLLGELPRESPQRISFVFSDNVRKDSEGEPGGSGDKQQNGMSTTVAKSTCVATGSRFWTTMIATKIARIEAIMSFKLSSTW